VTGRGKRRAPQSFTVIGVLPAGFRFTYPLETEVWAMQSWKAVETAHPDSIEFDSVARLAPGVTLKPQSPGGGPEDGRALPHPCRYPGDPAGGRLGCRQDAAIHPLVAAVSLLLLFIACATVANALLVRMASGNANWRYAPPWARAAGAWSGNSLRKAGTFPGRHRGRSASRRRARSRIPSLVPLTLNRADEMAVEPGLLIVPAAAATLVTLLSLLAPILHGSRVEVAQVLKGSAGSPSAPAGGSPLSLSRPTSQPGCWLAPRCS